MLTSQMQLHEVQTTLHAAVKHHKKLCVSVRSARHKELIERSQDPLAPVEVKDRPNLEADVRYRRLDNSAELAADARYAFAAGLAKGEAGLQLARQALLIAAEDDAIASSSVVRFPVDAFMSRMQRLAADTAASLAAAAAAANLHDLTTSRSSSDGQWASIRSLPPQEAVAAVQHTLFHPQLQPGTTQTPAKQRQPAWYSSVKCVGFQVPAYGRSNLPKQSMLDHPGVWEDARMSYMNEVLVRKRGSPAALVILMSEVYRQLLLMGAIDFAVTFDYGDFNSLPVAQPLPNLTLQQLLLQPDSSSEREPAASSTTSSSYISRQGQQLLNTCSSEALCELLRHLKRAYWPFPWDTNVDCYDAGGRGSTGGFRAAAKAALGSDDMSAALKAVSATAAHRLQRGIWTSPGAGDLSRCLAAVEKLVMMVGDEQPQERRDLAVLLLHAGQPAAAAAELSAYLKGVRSALGSVQQDPFDVRLAQDLRKMLTESGVKPARELMCVETVLQGSSCWQQQEAGNGDSEPFKPLVW